MANLKVKIVSRVTSAVGARSWVPASAAAHPAPLYLLYYQGSKPKYDRIPDNWIDAEIAKMRKERQLRAASMGVELPQEQSEAPKRHRLTDTIKTYISLISRPDKNGDHRPEKSINSTRSELERFVAWSKKSYMDEITRGAMERFRDELIQKYEPDTVVNKLMTVATFFKHNPVAPQPSPLPASEFPDKKVTIPDPYTEEEFDAMMEHATNEEGLLLYFFATTGMREQEIAHARREHIDWNLGEIHIVKGNGFLGKTAAALRAVPLPDDLLDELKLKGDGVLFPWSHYIRTIEKLATAAKVTPTSKKPHMKAAGMVKNDWCHRFRDTRITNALHACKGTAADILRLCEQIGHADMKTLNKYFGKLKKPYVPKLPAKFKKAKKVTEIDAA